jgi:hypothetical protein
VYTVLDFPPCGLSNSLQRLKLGGVGAASHTLSLWAHPRDTRGSREGHRERDRGTPEGGREGHPREAGREPRGSREGAEREGAESSPEGGPRRIGFFARAQPERSPSGGPRGAHPRTRVHCGRIMRAGWHAREGSHARTHRLRTRGERFHAHSADTHARPFGYFRFRGWRGRKARTHPESRQAETPKEKPKGAGREAREREREAAESRDERGPPTRAQSSLPFRAGERKGERTFHISRHGRTGSEAARHAEQRAGGRALQRSPRGPRG